MRISLYEDPDLLQLYFNDLYDPNWQSAPPAALTPVPVPAVASATSHLALRPEPDPTADTSAEAEHAQSNVSGFQKASVLVPPADGGPKGGEGGEGGLRRSGSGVTASLARTPPIGWNSVGDRKAYVPRYRVSTNIKTLFRRSCWPRSALTPADLAIVTLRRPSPHSRSGAI